jgi:hypothetical protein
VTREEYLEKQRAYNQSDAGRRRQWRYDDSAKRAAAHARYEAKHPERKRRYHLVP